MSEKEIKDARETVDIELTSSIRRKIAKKSEKVQKKVNFVHDCNNEPTTAPVSLSEKFRVFSESWKKAREDYLFEEKPAENRNVIDIADSIGSVTLTTSSFLNLFSYYRDLRELVLRIHSFKVKKLLRELLSGNEIEMAFQLLRLVELDALFLKDIDRDDEKVKGVSVVTRDNLVKMIDDDIFEDDLSTWISYILFFSNPSSQFIRLKKLFFDLYFQIVDTGLLYLLMNNKIIEVKNYIARKKPDVFKTAPDFDLPPLVRVDRHFSKFRQKPCEKRCPGHEGKLLLLLIRLQNNELVELLINHGVRANSMCCSGQIKKLFWLKDEEIQGDDDFLVEEESVEFRRPTADGLQAVYELVTPLSVAVERQNVRCVKLLLAKNVSPLLANDIAIRECVHNVLERTKVKKQRVHEFLTDEVVSYKEDREFIFEAILDAADKDLQKKNLFVPGYSRIALIYQAVKDQIWETEAVLTALKQKTSFSNALNKYNMRNGSIFSTPGLPMTQIVTKKPSRTKRGLFLGSRKSRKSSTGSEAKSFFKSNNTRRRLTITSKMNDSMISLKGKFKKTVSNISGKLHISGLGSKRKKRKVQLSSAFESSESESEKTAVESEVEVLKEVNTEMKEDLCFALVSVFDRLMKDLLTENAVNRGIHLKAALFILERHQIYLNHDRWVVFLSSIVETLKNLQPGDTENVTKALKNEQFQHFLGISPQRLWKKRDIKNFVKDAKIRKMLNIGRKKTTVVSEAINVRKKESLSKEDLFNQLLLLLAKLNFHQEMKEIVKGKIEIREDTPENMMKLACVHENIDAISSIAFIFGPSLLQTGLQIALDLKKPLSCQRIIAVDSELTEKHLSLMQNYVGNQLFLANPVVLDARNFHDEEEDLDLDEFEATVTFFLSCLLENDNLRNLLEQILFTCFQSTETLNLLGVLLYIDLCLEVFEDFVTEELLEAFISSKEVQFDELDAKIAELEAAEPRKSENAYEIGVSSLSNLTRRKKKSSEKILGEKIKNLGKRRELRERKKDLRQGRWVKVLEKLYELVGNEVSKETSEVVEALLMEMPERYRGRKSRSGSEESSRFEEDAWTIESDEWGNKPLL